MPAYPEKLVMDVYEPADFKRGSHKHSGGDPTGIRKRFLRKWKTSQNANKAQ